MWPEFKRFVFDEAQPVMLGDDDQDLIYISPDGLLIWNVDTRHWIKPYDSGHGRYRVKLATFKGWREFYIHRLVAQAFIPNPRCKPLVHHVDGNPANNDVSNLVWVDEFDHKTCHGLMKHFGIDSQKYKDFIRRLRRHENE